MALAAPSAREEVEDDEEDGGGAATTTAWLPPPPLLALEEAARWLESLPPLPPPTPGRSSPRWLRELELLGADLSRLLLRDVAEVEEADEAPELRCGPRRLLPPPVLLSRSRSRGLLAEEALRVPPDPAGLESRSLPRFMAPGPAAQEAPPAAAAILDKRERTKAALPSCRAVRASDVITPRPRLERAERPPQFRARAEGRAGEQSVAGVAPFAHLSGREGRARP